MSFPFQKPDHLDATTIFYKSRLETNSEKKVIMQHREFLVSL